MSEEINPMWAVVPSMLALVFVLGCIIGGSIGHDTCVSRAVKANAAHYILDENNERQFRWGPKP